MITSRRSLFGFGAALIAAPAIVRVASIMPVSVPKRIIRFLPYNATTHALTIADVRRFKDQCWAAIQAQPITYTVPVSEEWLNIMLARAA